MLETGVTEAKTVARETFPFDIPYSERSLAIACTRGRHAVVSHFTDLLKDAGLTEQQWRVIRIISDFAPLSLNELSQKDSPRPYGSRTNLH